MMAQNTKIEWTESTWNPVTGCTKISPGCQNCYAERMSLRLQAANNPSYLNGFSVTLHERMLTLPLTWKKPQSIFVNSMSDLFHEAIPDDFIFRVFEIMNQAKRHRFQVLTKRSQRLLQLNKQLKWAPNIWMGVSVEDSNRKFRIDHLRQTDATLKFLSIEPLLGPIGTLNLDGIGWVVVGGESGPKARPMKAAWVTPIRDQCNLEQIPFFFKQWGGFNKKKAGRELEGRIWNEAPV